MTPLDVAEELPQRDFSGNWEAPRAFRSTPFPAPAQGNGPGRHTKLWQELSWCIGDTHATRICRIIDVYVRFFGLRGRAWR